MTDWKRSSNPPTGCNPWSGKCFCHQCRHVVYVNEDDVFSDSLTLAGCLAWGKWVVVELLRPLSFIGKTLNEKHVRLRDDDAMDSDERGRQDIIFTCSLNRENYSTRRPRSPGMVLLPLLVSHLQKRENGHHFSVGTRFTCHSWSGSTNERNIASQSCPIQTTKIGRFGIFPGKDRSIDVP